MNKLIKKNIFCTSALTLMIATGVCSAAPLSGFIYAANKRDGSISEITLATELVRTFKASIVPHNVQITPDGDFLLSVGIRTYALISAANSDICRGHCVGSNSLADENTDPPADR